MTRGNIARNCAGATSRRPWPGGARNTAAGWGCTAGWWSEPWGGCTSSAACGSATSAVLTSMKPSYPSAVQSSASDVWLLFVRGSYSSADEIIEAVQVSLDQYGEALSQTQGFDDLHTTLMDFLNDVTGEDMCATLTEHEINREDASRFVGCTISKCVSYLLSMDHLDGILSHLESEVRREINADVVNDGRIAGEIGRRLAGVFSKRLAEQGPILAYQAFVEWVSDAPHT